MSYHDYEMPIQVDRHNLLKFRGNRHIKNLDIREHKSLMSTYNSHEIMITYFIHDILANESKKYNNLEFEDANHAGIRSFDFKSSDYQLMKKMEKFTYDLIFTKVGILDKIKEKAIAYLFNKKIPFRNLFGIVKEENLYCINKREANNINIIKFLEENNIKYYHYVTTCRFRHDLSIMFLKKYHETLFKLKFC